MKNKSVPLNYTGLVLSVIFNYFTFRASDLWSWSFSTQLIILPVLSTIGFFLIMIGTDKVLKKFARTSLKYTKEKSEKKI
ncbi:hypothetical protein EFO90_06955 [Lactiplantibacillus plantarum]|uniref:hypothetical protein n=1 Tax=Lactiplantibacillus plantarum TaxID=1590 RepID=UPI0021A60E03|nr:hypothetical protein [Lactiplantibacillus plantarum]MCT3214134.1 hypothetical protein [Lactiplantibacillus plantarum]MCT3271726.1 hypothetical protein [Lactiplantibacillus plantarum]